MKKYFFLLLFFTARLAGRGQEVAAIAQAFTAYQWTHRQEKVFVHTDKTFYLAGETIWFSVYDVSAATHRPSSLSRVAYLELGNGQGRTIAYTKVALDAGIGSGSLVVPASWPTARYTLRCYTAWMKNFPAAFYYEQTIPVANTLRGSAYGSPGSVSDAVIRFFPEGGNLVMGLAARVGIQATGKDGQGIPCSGFVVNQQGDTLAAFRSALDGRGHFDLTAAPGDTLQGICVLNGLPKRVALPVACKEGYTLQMRPSQNGRLLFTVRTTAGENNKPVYLIGHTRGVLKTIEGQPVKNGEALFTIDPAILGDGISAFTLLNRDRQPVCERLYFKVPAARLNISLPVAAGEYNPRSAISLPLSTQDVAGRPSAAALSASVFLLDSLQDIPVDNILTYLYLTSELRGKIADPAGYFNGDTAVAAATDDLLLTGGWRRFSWDSVFSLRPPAFAFLPEAEGPVVFAHAEDKTTGQPARDIPFLLSFPGRQFQVSAAATDPGGNLYFTAPPSSGSGLAVLTPANQKDSNYRIDINPVFADMPFSPDGSGQLIPRRWMESLAARHLSLQVETSYRTAAKRRFTSGFGLDSVAFYGKPDLAFHLEDYTRYVTMEEVLREFVLDVRVRKEGDKFRLRVRNLLFNTFFEQDPLILLDGVPVFDASKIVALDPMKISDINVISHRFFKGAMAFDGVVSVKSYDGDLGATVLDPAAVVIDYESIQQQREFYAPIYTDSAAHPASIPDYRTQLSWLPRLATGADGKTELHFFTSDVTGKFAVMVEGITAAGVPGSAVMTFSVRAK